MPEKLSPVEVFKQESQFLAGEIATELSDGNDFFGKSSIQLLKHHGTYQQDDRDNRGGGSKSYIFMVRTKLPGGRLTAAQMLAELDICDSIGNTTLRITSRQGLQLHGVIKSDLQPTIQRLHEAQLTTLGACGDVNRNVMCCPAPLDTPVHRELHRLSDELAEYFAPRTTAYHEIWVTDTSNGEKTKIKTGEEVEPIYGSSYLPRKFKMGVGLADDNCVNLYTHDLGFLAVVKDGEVVGYNLLVGGGQGVTPANKKTFPALAHRLGYVPKEDVVAAAEAVVKVQRDFGNREDRKVARLKYLIHNWGLEKFRQQVNEYFGKELADCDPVDVHGFDDHMGWAEQGDGAWYYGLNVENGRIHDTDSMQLKTAIRAICGELEPDIRLTSHQSIMFCNLRDEQKSRLEELLRQHHVLLTEEVSTIRRWSMACVAWPTCGLSITESERALPGMMDQLEAELEKLGLSEEALTVRMTGCPNGCARPYNCDIGLVGKAKGKYTVLIGGRLLGDRLNSVYRDSVPAEEVVATLVPLFTQFKHQRSDGEGFGDFCNRVGIAELQEQNS